MELIYPDEVAPLVPGAKGHNEMLPVVEPTGRVIARAPRAWCHGGAMLLHPVVHLQIIDRYGRIYLQRRSAVKHRYPLCWDTAVAGHVSYGESLLESLYREATEELGFTDFYPIPITSYVREAPDQRELVHVWAAVGSFDLKPDGFEVIEGRWWEVPEIETACGTGTLTPTFEEEFKMLKDQLLALL